MDSQSRVFICDVAPRDGLQNVARPIATADKIALINQLSAAGLRRIEATAFVSPRAIPQLADAEQVMYEIKRLPGVEYVVLVPNLRGAERAVACRPDEFNVVMSVSESHNRANLNMTMESSFKTLTEVVKLAQSRNVKINVSLSCSFGCPFEGDVSLGSITQWIERFSAQGVTSYTLCDTTGMAYPKQVREVCVRLKNDFPHHLFTLHFHDTRGLGVANVLAAVERGISRFDTSLGGLGGCRYAPGATGNSCTEDVVHALHLEGYETGVCLETLIAVARILPALIGNNIPSHVAAAGSRALRYALHDMRSES